MKTTLELSDDLMRSVKIKAVEENKKLKEMVSELLRLGLDASEGADHGRRMQFPIIEGGRTAEPDQEMTPERVAEILLDQEVDRSNG